MMIITVSVMSTRGKSSCFYPDESKKIPTQKNSREMKIFAAQLNVEGDGCVNWKLERAAS